MNLASVTAASTALKDTDTIIVEVSGVIKRVSIANFRTVINSGDSQLLNSSAFGFTINTSSDTGVRKPTIVGSSSVREAYMAEVGRYYLKRDGSVAVKLMTTDSTKYQNGTSVPTGTGDVMVRLPKLYYKVETSSTKVTVWLSPNPISKYFFEESWVGAFLGYVSSSKLRSVSGYTPTLSATITNLFTYANANGSDFGIMSYDQWRQIVMLFIANYTVLGTKNTIDIQASIGYGVTGSNGANDNTAIANALAVAKTGVTNSLGDATGKIAVSYNNPSTAVSNACNVSLFGIENMWGLAGQMLQGVYTGSSSNSGQDGTEVFVYKGNRLPTSAELSVSPNGEYRQISRILTSGYVTAALLGEHFDLFATAVTIAGGTYYCDYQNEISTEQYISIGGYMPTNASSGLFCLNSAHQGSEHTTRLAYYGKPKIADKF